MVRVTNIKTYKTRHGESSICKLKSHDRVRITPMQTHSNRHTDIYTMTWWQKQTERPTHHDMSDMVRVTYVQISSKVVVRGPRVVEERVVVRERGGVSLYYTCSCPPDRLWSGLVHGSSNWRKPSPQPPPWPPPPWGTPWRTQPRPPQKTLGGNLTECF